MTWDAYEQRGNDLRPIGTVDGDYLCALERAKDLPRTFPLPSAVVIRPTGSPVLDMSERPKVIIDPCKKGLTRREVIEANRRWGRARICAARDKWLRENMARRPRL